MATQETTEVKETQAKNTTEGNKEQEKKLFNPRVPGVYFLLFLVSFCYWELLLRIDAGGVARNNLTLFVFLPAEAMFFAALCGFFEKHPVLNTILSSVLIFIITVYYYAQLIYNRLFGSFISIGLVGLGGEAMGQFGWTLSDTLKRSILHAFLFLLPLAANIILSVFRAKAEKAGRPSVLPGRAYRLWLHFACLGLSLILWFAAVLGLYVVGHDRQSAWSVMRNPFADTDTTAGRIGVLATSVVEFAAIHFGIGYEDNGGPVVMTTDDMDLIRATSAPSPAPREQLSKKTVSENETVSENSVSENEVFEPVPRINEAIDFAALKEMSTDPSIQALCDYYNARIPSVTSEYTGLFEGYNLVYICAESFSAFGIDPEITPTMYKMATGGIVLNNFYNSFPNTTTNGEFAFATSLWPDVSRYASGGTTIGSFPQSVSRFMPYGLGDFFNSEDVTSYAAHNFFGEYYGRMFAWPNLGYNEDETKFLGKGMNFTSSWPASDLEMFEQSVDDYIHDDEFHVYYMTFSGHGPYNASNYMYNKNIEKVRELAGDRYKDDCILGYFCGEYELELGLEYLVDRLEEAGKMDKTVFVVIGDHFPYYLSETARMEYNGGTPMSKFQEFKSTCIIYNSAIEEPIQCDTYCCNVDILPTMLNLFNIDFDSRLLAGNDIFSSGVHRARLYDGSFLTDFVRYDSASGEVIWSDEAASFSEAEKERYLNAMMDYTEAEYSASLNLMKNNFFLYVWNNSGLMTEEEYLAEVKREEDSSARLYAGEAAFFTPELDEDAAAAAAEAAEAAAAAEAASQEQQAQQPEQQQSPQQEPQPEQEQQAN